MVSFIVVLGKGVFYIRKIREMYVIDFIRLILSGQLIINDRRYIKIETRLTSSYCHLTFLDLFHIK